jgi:hypothetical protein
MTESIKQVLSQVAKLGLFFRLRGSQVWALPEAVPLIVKLSVAGRFELRATLQRLLGSKNEDGSGLVERWPASVGMETSTWPFVRLNLRSRNLVSCNHVTRRICEAAAARKTLWQETVAGCQPAPSTPPAPPLPLWRQQQELSLQSKPWRRFFNHDASANYR